MTAHESYLVSKAILVLNDSMFARFDRVNKPMVLHSLRVGSMGKSADEMVVGFLHDVIEDTHITLEYLRRLYFPEHQVFAVDAVSRRKADGESYRDFIRRVKDAGPLAIAVKLNDVTDNIGRVHELPDEKERMSLFDKWTWARLFLTDQHL